MFTGKWFDQVVVGRVNIRPAAAGTMSSLSFPLMDEQGLHTLGVRPATNQKRVQSRVAYLFRKRSHLRLGAKSFQCRKPRCTFAERAAIANQTPSHFLRKKARESFCQTPPPQPQAECSKDAEVGLYFCRDAREGRWTFAPSEDLMALAAGRPGRSLKTAMILQSFIRMHGFEIIARERNIVSGKEQRNLVIDFDHKIVNPPATESSTPHC